MKKWLPVLGEYAIGMLVFLVYTGGFLFISLTYLKNSLEEFGRNTELNEILFFFLVIIFSIILIPVGNIVLYKQFKLAGRLKIANGIVCGLLLTLTGLCIIVSLNEIERNEALQPHSEEYLNFQQELLKKEAEALKREELREIEEWENVNKADYARNDSLKRLKDSLQNEKDWQKVLQAL